MEGNTSLEDADARVLWPGKGRPGCMYAIAQGATEIPWALAQTLLFSCIAYFMIHFDFTAGELTPWFQKSLSPQGL